MGPQIQSGNDLPVNSGQDQELAAKIGGNSAQTTGRLAAADSPDVWIYPHGYWSTGTDGTYNGSGLCYFNGCGTDA